MMTNTKSKRGLLTGKWKSWKVVSLWCSAEDFKLGADHWKYRKQVVLYGCNFWEHVMDMYSSHD